MNVCYCWNKDVHRHQMLYFTFQEKCWQSLGYGWRPAKCGDMFIWCYFTIKGTWATRVTAADGYSPEILQYPELCLPQTKFGQVTGRDACYTWTWATTVMILWVLRFIQKAIDYSWKQRMLIVHQKTIFSNIKNWACLKNSRSKRVDAQSWWQVFAYLPDIKDQLIKWEHEHW